MVLPREEATNFMKELELTEGFPSWIIGVVEKSDVRSARIVPDVRVIEVPQRDTPDDLW